MMNYTLTVKNDSIVYIKSEDILITDAQSALDLMMTVKYDTGCSRLVLDKGAISEDFFRLSSGMAGEVLQKFINYHMKLAVLGDYSRYTSKPLQDFIYESNRGRDIFFVENMEQAVEKLENARD